jgi:hypothetical protein
MTVSLFCKRVGRSANPESHSVFPGDFRLDDAQTYEPNATASAATAASALHGSCQGFQDPLAAPTPHPGPSVPATLQRVTVRPARRVPDPVVAVRESTGPRAS